MNYELEKMDYRKCENILCLCVSAFVKDREAESEGGCVMIEKMSGWE